MIQRKQVPQLSLADQVAIDIGLFVQAVGAFELSLDDLVCLDNERFRSRGPISARYPQNLSEKLSLLPKIALHVGFSEPSRLAKENFERVDRVRNLFAHGKVVNIQSSISGYRVRVAKMGRPAGQTGSQKLERKHFVVTSKDLFYCCADLAAFAVVIEELRVSVFSAGKGWPKYLLSKEGDPLELSGLVERFSRYNTVEPEAEE